MLKTVFLACFASACSAFAADLQAQPAVSKWEKDIAAFECADATNLPPKGALLFIGSSTVRMWKTLRADFPNHAVINRGFGGSQIADAVQFAPRIVIPYAPKAVYLRSGGNDLWAGKSVDQVSADFQNAEGYKLLAERVRADVEREYGEVGTRVSGKVNP